MDHSDEKVLLFGIRKEFNYLMLGLNPLDPKIKDVDPKKIY